MYIHVNNPVTSRYGYVLLSTGAVYSVEYQSDIFSCIYTLPEHRLIHTCALVSLQCYIYNIENLGHP